LIEVIGALVIFSVGVLMVIGLSRSLSSTMQYAAASSEIVVLANARLDSLQAEPFDSLTIGSTSDTLRVGGTTYRRVVSVTLVTALLKQIDVSLTPLDAGQHPGYSATSYMANSW